MNAQPNSDPKRGIEAAIGRWQADLPAAVVRLDEATLDHRGRTTYEPTRAVSAVLQPTCPEQVQTILRIASDCQAPVYPVSQGRNWGYGSAAPVREAAAVLDLSRMNRILEINEGLAYAVIEPGVTQQQLFEALQERGADLIPDATGAGPDASIVGNFLDRGFGHTPIADHQNQFAGIEVVLADGRVLRTGYAALGADRIGDLARGGPGAGIDSLLIQSNLAVITRMAVWLYPKPERCVAFALKVKDPANLHQVVEQMRHLRFHGVLNGAPHLANDYRVLAIRERFPFDTADPEKGLTPKQRQELRDKHGTTPWTLLAGIYGTNRQVRANIREAKRAFRGLGRSLVVGDTLLSVGATALRLLPFLPQRLHKDLETAKEMMQMLAGDPVAGPRQGAYWRHRTATYELGRDPLTDRVGYRGLSPVLPFTGADVVRFNDACEEICARFGFEFALTITNLAPRHGIGVISITYDRENEAEEQRAIQCVDEISRTCRGMGFEPYRLPTWGMASQAARWPATLREVMLGVKTAFDPGHIVAPGRYLPQPDDPTMGLMP
ncbi:MAG: FAD-binding oxidoreductase [Phycisphaerales bacterium JB038]